MDDQEFERLRAESAARTAKYKASFRYRLVQWEKRHQTLLGALTWTFATLALGKCIYDLLK